MQDGAFKMGDGGTICPSQVVQQYHNKIPYQTKYTDFNKFCQWKKVRKGGVIFKKHKNDILNNEEDVADDDKDKSDFPPNVQYSSVLVLVPVFVTKKVTSVVYNWHMFPLI